MTWLSSDEGRMVDERLLSADTTFIEPSFDAWSQSLEVWVNGELRMPGSDFGLEGSGLRFVETLQAGDTLRLCGLRRQSTP